MVKGFFFIFYLLWKKPSDCSLISFWFLIQVENALKAAESAQTSLHAERQSSKALLLTEEEIKSLQLQVKFNFFLGSREMILFFRTSKLE